MEDARSGSGLSDVSEPKANDEEDLSADVDRLMGKIEELQNLTTSSLEHQVTPPSSPGLDSPTLSATLSPLLSRGTASSSAAMWRSKTLPNTRRHGSTGYFSHAPTESSPIAVRGRCSSTTVFEGLQAAIQQVQNLNEGSEPGSDHELDLQNVLYCLQERIVSLEKEVSVWSGNLQESEVRIRTEVFTKLEQTLEAELHMRCKALESQVLAKLPSPHHIPAEVLRVPMRSIREDAGKVVETIAKVEKLANSSLDVCAGLYVKAYAPSSKTLPERIASLEKQVSVWSGNLQESEVRISTEVFTKLEQTLEAELHTRCKALESQVLAKFSSPHHIPAEVLRVPMQRIREDAGKMVETIAKVEQLANSSLDVYAGLYAKASAPACKILPGRHLEDTANLAKEKQSDTGQPDQITLMKAATQEMSELRQEVFDMEERLRTYLKAETQARVEGHQLLMREIDRKAKARLLGTPSSGAFDGASSVAPVSSRGAGSNGRLPYSGLARKGEADLQLGNIARHCARIAETLSSNIDEEPVRTRVIHLSNDLGKVATYLSGTLQLQLESMSEVISFLRGELETMAQVSHPSRTTIASKMSTSTSSSSVIAPTLSTAMSCPLQKSTSAGWNWPGSGRTLPADELVRMSYPRSASFQGVEEVYLGTPRSIGSSNVAVVAPPNQSQMPRPRSVSPTTMTPPSFVPSLNAIGPQTPSTGSGRLTPGTTPRRGGD